MVVADVCDDGQNGGDDVCTVEASSQSHFYDGIVYLLFFEILESQGKKDEALELYKEIKQKYFNSMQYQEIDKYIERASTK